jgi:hypothetical protein
LAGLQEVSISTLVQTKHTTLEVSNKRDFEKLLEEKNILKGRVPRKGRCWKVQKEKRRMVLGDDVLIGDIPNMVGRMVIGRFYGKSVTPTALKLWLVDHWQSLLGYFPIYYKLARGWICLFFKRHKDMMEMFRLIWGWGESGLVLKEWPVSFDPTHDVLATLKVWAIFPKLSLDF